MYVVVSKSTATISTSGSALEHIVDNGTDARGDV